MAKTIMVMHEDPDTRGSIKTLLEKNGYSVIDVDSFETFLKRVHEKPDLVLLDGLMPRNKIIEITREEGIKIAYFVSCQYPFT